VNAAVKQLLRDRAFRRAVVIVVALRVVLGIYGVLTLYFGREPAWLPRAQRFDHNHMLSSLLIYPFQRFDALIYGRIAINGYKNAVHTNDIAFFPLFPTVVGAIGRLFGGDLLAASWVAVIIATLAYIAALTMLDHLVARHHGREVAERTVLYSAVFPTAFFFLAGYTESLFLALVCGVFLAAERRRWVLAGLLAALATLTRSQGIVLVVPLAVEIGFDAWKRLRHRKLPVVAGYMAPLLAVAAFLGYNYYASNIVGAPILAAEKAGWFKVPVVPGKALLDDISWYIHTRKGLPDLLSALALVGGSVIAWLRLRWSWAAYASIAAAANLSITVTHPFISPSEGLDRYVLTVFPLFVLAAMFTGRSRWLHYGWLTASAALLLFYFARYVAFQFVA
jgi:Mannosyltransferase (PIG-V)